MPEFAQSRPKCALAACLSCTGSKRTTASCKHLFSHRMSAHTSESSSIGAASGSSRGSIAAGHATTSGPAAKGSEEAPSTPPRPELPSSTTENSPPPRSAPTTPNEANPRVWTNLSWPLREKKPSCRSRRGSRPSTPDCNQSNSDSKGPSSSTSAQATSRTESHISVHKLPPQQEPQSCTDRTSSPTNGLCVFCTCPPAKWRFCTCRHAKW